MTRRYCGIVGCGIDESEGDRCPECGASWSVHREIDAATGGAFTPCPDAPERRDPAMPGRQLRDHGHHCELAPGHAGEHRARGCEVTT